MPVLSDEHVPPELLYTVETDDPLDILHPALRGKPSWGLGQRRLWEGGHRGLRQITALSRGRVEPEGPRRIEGMLTEHIHELRILGL